MNLAERMKSASIKEENLNQIVAQEIYNYFEDIFESGKFETELEKRLTQSKDTINNRSYKMNVEFWDYHSGCSSTHFRIFCFEWNNPEGKSFESRNYKGVRLFSIHKEVCARLFQMTIDKLHKMGFVTSYQGNYNNLGYYEKEITIRW